MTYRGMTNRLQCVKSEVLGYPVQWVVQTKDLRLRLGHYSLVTALHQLCLVAVSNNRDDNEIVPYEEAL